MQKDSEKSEHKKKTNKTKRRHIQKRGNTIKQKADKFWEEETQENRNHKTSERRTHHKTESMQILKRGYTAKQREEILKKKNRKQRDFEKRQDIRKDIHS